MDFEQDFFAIDVMHHAGIPALEHELTTNKYYILIFTSMQAARLYCYHRAPDKINDVFQMERALIGNDFVQTGLQRVVRRCLLGYSHIVGILWNHPGLIGAAVEETSLQDVLTASLKDKNEQRKFTDELTDYFNSDESKVLR